MYRRDVPHLIQVIESFEPQPLSTNSLIPEAINVSNNSLSEDYIVNNDFCDILKIGKSVKLWMTTKIFESICFDNDATDSNMLFSMLHKFVNGVITSFSSNLMTCSVQLFDNTIVNYCPVSLLFPCNADASNPFHKHRPVLGEFLEVSSPTNNFLSHWCICVSNIFRLSDPDVSLYAKAFNAVPYGLTPLNCLFSEAPDKVAVNDEEMKLGKEVVFVSIAFPPPNCPQAILLVDLNMVRRLECFLPQVSDHSNNSLDCDDKIGFFEPHQRWLVTVPSMEHNIPFSFTKNEFYAENFVPDNLVNDLSPTISQNLKSSPEKKIVVRSPCKEVNRFNINQFIKLKNEADHSSSTLSIQTPSNQDHNISFHQNLVESLPSPSKTCLPLPPDDLTPRNLVYRYSRPPQIDDTSSSASPVNSIKIMNKDASKGKESSNHYYPASTPNFNIIDQTNHNEINHHLTMRNNKKRMRHLNSEPFSSFYNNAVVPNEENNYIQRHQYTPRSHLYGGVSSSVLSTSPGSPSKMSLISPSSPTASQFFSSSQNFAPSCFTTTTEPSFSDKFNSGFSLTSPKSTNINNILELDKKATCQLSKRDNNNIIFEKEQNTLESFNLVGIPLTSLFCYDNNSGDVHLKTQSYLTFLHQIPKDSIRLISFPDSTSAVNVLVENRQLRRTTFKNYSNLLDQNLTNKNVLKDVEVSSSSKWNLRIPSCIGIPLIPILKASESFFEDLDIDDSKPMPFFNDDQSNDDVIKEFWEELVASKNVIEKNHLEVSRLGLVKPPDELLPRWSFEATFKTGFSSSAANKTQKFKRSIQDA